MIANMTANATVENKYPKSFIGQFHKSSFRTFD